MSKKIKIGDCYQDGSFTFVIEHGPDDERFGVLTADGGGSAIGSVGFLSENEILRRLSSTPTLHLPISNDPKKYGGAWFDLIRSGEKKEEYREFFGMGKGSPINIKNLVDWEKEDWQWLMRSFVERSEFMYDQISFKPWKVLHLTNGYGPKNQQLWAHIESITIGRGNPEWGAPVDRDVFIIKIGAVFHTKNLKQ